MRTKRSKKLVSILLALVLLLTGIGPSVFAAEPASPDLAVTALSPANGAGGVDPGAALVITFNQAVNINRADGAAYDLVISDEENNARQAVLEANAEQTVWTADFLEGQAPLAAGHTYTISNRITSEPGSEAQLCTIRAAEDNSQTLDFPVWSFATIAAATEDEQGGSPIQAGSLDQGEGPDQGELGTVHVRVADKVARQASELDQLGAAYKQPFGEILPWTEVAITAGMSMMEAIEAGLSAGRITTYTTTSGYGTYISGIGPVTSSDGGRTVEKLSEADSGSASGWMTTLNGWFPSSGADTVTVQDGDYVELGYSCNYGADLGADWSNPDTTLKSLTVSAGTLSPEFASATKDYTLTLPEAAGVTVQPVAANRNNQVTIQAGGITYRPTDPISVNDEQSITISCAGNTYTLTVAIQAAPGANSVPARKTGVEAAAAAQVPAGSAYTLDLATIFEDADPDDVLTYKVKINDAEAVDADAGYSYTPAQTGEVTLIFTAYDGTADSEDTYTVTLTVTAPPALTVRLDGQKFSGDSLEAIITASGKNRFQIEIFEFTAGKFTPADWTYLQASYNSRTDRTQPASIIFSANVDTTGPGCAFTNGFSTLNHSGMNVIRFECNGIETLNGQITATNAKGLPVAFWFPDLKNMGLSDYRAFSNAVADVLYLPKLETINKSSFYNCKAKYLILTGNAPTVATADLTGATFTVWVPADKLSGYTTTQDPNTGEKLWFGRPIKTFPSELTDLHKLVSHVINQIPEDSEAFTLEDLDNILLAQYLTYILPLGNGVSAQEATALSAAQSELIAALVDKIRELPARSNLTAADADKILRILSIYNNFNSQQKQLFDRSYPAIFDEMLRKYAAIIASAHPTAQMILYSPEKGTGWGSALSEVIQSMGVTAAAARGEVQTLYVLKGSFTGTSLLDLKGTNAFTNLTKLYATGEVDINSGMIIPRMFGTTARTFAQVVLPSITEIQSQGLYKITSVFQVPNVERIGESIFQDATAAKIDSFLPRLVSSESKLPADSPLILPRLQNGRNVYDTSGERYIFLPALENAGANFFKDTTALEAAWLPELKTIDGKAFAGSAIQELYLQADPPEVTGAAPFSGLSNERVAYVPDALLEAYSTVADGHDQDGKWYGWEVKPFSASTTAAALLNAYIELLPPNAAINIEHSEWLRSIASARNNLSSEEQSKVDSRLNNAITAVATYEQTNAQNVTGLIEALKPVGELTLEDRAAVRAARVAYDRLITGVKNAVTNYADLVAAEEKINALALADAQAKITALPAIVTIENKGLIRAAYSAYLELPESVRAQLTQQEKQKLQIALDEVVALETAGLSAKIVDDKITALPAPANLTLNHESAVKGARAAYNSLSAAAKAGVTKLDILVAAEAKISELKNIKPEGVKTIYLSVEKFTLGQGYVKTPIAVTAQAGDNAATLLTRVLGSGNYTNGGAVNDGFYLQAIKDDDSTPANIPAYILQRIAQAGSEAGNRRTSGWLGEFDYTDMSGWMFTVNNELASGPEGGLLGASDYTYDLMTDGDVIRWQFTVYGYGADLGLDSVFGDAYIAAADKGALTAKIAGIDASADKPAWMAHTDYAQAYREALRVLQDMESSQAAVDASLAAISNTPTTDAPIGTVTVTVRDTVPRRQVTTTTTSLPVAFRNLTDLGNYQNPFGVLLNAVEVPLTVGMTAQQAVKAALAGRGYTTFDSGGAITGIGPVTTADKSATVEDLSDGDAGDRSKWVLSRNQVAIFNSAQPVYPKDGDSLFLDYSVDGGYDVQCYSYAHTYFDVSFNTAVQVSGSNLNFTFLVPEGTQTLALSYTVKGSDEQPDAYNRYKTLTFSSNNIVYDQGEEIPITDGQLISVKVGIDGGGSTHNPFAPNQIVVSVGSEAMRTMKCTIVFYPVLADLIGDIQALPAFADLDYDVHYSPVMDMMRRYNLLTAEDKALIPSEETAKLTAAHTEMKRIYDIDYAAWLEVYYPISQFSTALKQENYLQLLPQLEGLREAFNGLTPRQQAINNGSLASLLAIIDQKIAEYEETLNFQASLGTATNYRNDFMLTGYGFNIDICTDFEQDLAAKKLQEVVFFDTPRISLDNGATNHPLLEIEVKDPEILEVRKVSSPNPNSPSQQLEHYYLVGKQAGTTTFTIHYPGFMGQTPETVVHVNSAGESGNPELAGILTNINEIARKYDTWHYPEGTPGAEFTFQVAGSNAQVKVLDYLQDTSKTYAPDNSGNVTVLLTDGYNPIVVTADLNGQTVTQVYGVRGKVVKYTLTNATSPGANTFKAGDTARLEILGLNTPIYKISRIYNPAATYFVFDTDMPRYTFLQSGGGQYTATTLEFELTAAGEFNLSNGRVTQSWFGSGLYAELPKGTAPPVLNAGQPNGVFSSLPDLHMTVQENPMYQPQLFHPEIEGGNTVQPGATVKLKIPDLDVAYINNKHTTTSSTIVDILEAYTLFKTDIPGLKSIKSAKAATANYNITTLKEITFTVPENTPPGEYHIGGGYVDVTSGPSWWMIYTVYYAGKIADLTIQVGDDRQAPQFAAGYPRTGNKGPTGFDLKLKLDEPGTVYYKILADSSDPGSDYLSWTAAAIAGTDEVTAPLSSLTPGATYAVYIIAKDAAGNWQSQPVRLDITLPADDKLAAMLAQAKDYYDLTRNKVLDSWWDLGAVFGGYGSLNGYTLPDYSGEFSGRQPTDYAGRILGELAAGGNPYRTQSSQDLIAGLIAFDSDGDGRFSTLVNQQTWAVIALNAAKAEETDGYYKEKAVQVLLNMQRSDGSFDAALPDYTGMALLALSTSREIAGVNAAINKAVVQLQTIQNKTGDYTGGWLNNSNTIATVISGLAAVGEDVSAAKWTVSGKNPLDALSLFQTGSGFKYLTSQTNINAMASYQSIIALGDALAGDSVWNRLPFGREAVVESAATTSSGKKILISFNKAMTNPAGQETQFALEVNGLADPENELIGAALNKEDRKIVELTLKKMIKHGQTVNVEYTKGTVTAADGGIVESFSQPVTNLVPEALQGTTANINSGSANKGVNITPDTLDSLSQSGDSSINVTIADEVKNATLVVAELLTQNQDGTVSVSGLPAVNISAATEISQNPVLVAIPEGTVITASADWDGSINVPTLKAKESVTVPTETGKTTKVETVIEIGYGDIPLTFNKAVRILLPGQAGKKVGYTRGTVFTPITTGLTADTQAEGDALPEGGDGYLNAGADLVIWTKHFTRFVSYTQTDTANPGGGTNPSETITVKFKLLGDAKHGTEGTRHVYKNNAGSFQTWIPASSVTVPENSTVYDVFTQVLDDKGLQYDESQANYIGGIKAPASFGGHWLYEFDNGPLSGWMYTVNGTHPNLGLRDYVLRDGDVIVWHYTDDYTKEKGSENWANPGGGAAETAVVSSDKEFSADRLKELREGNKSLALQYGQLSISLNPQALPAITEGKIKIETSLISETTALNSFFLAYPGLTGVLKGFSVSLTQESNGKTQPLTELNGNIDLHFTLEANEIKGLDPSTLIVYKQGEDGKITEYPGTYDWTKGVVTISVNHLCRFFIMGREGIPSQRLSGDDRYATAAAISADGWTTSDQVILASGENFPDALAATALAGLKNAPVLLTAKEVLDSLTLAEIKRLQAKTIWLIGGTGVISQAIEDQLKKDYTVTRLYGNDRYGTAVKIGERLREEKSLDTAILSTGLNYPDALSIAPFAGKSAYPILFSGQEELNGQSKEALVAWGIKNVYILGGSGVISGAIEDTLKGLGIKVTRLAGNDRYETSLAIVKHFADPATPYTKAALATGLDFPDALAGGARAAREGYPVLLVGTDAAAEQVRNYLQALLPETIYLYGGEKVIPDQLRYRISLKTL